MVDGQVRSRKPTVKLNGRAGWISGTRIAPLVIALAAAALWLAVRLLMTRGLPAPPPQIQDEFSYVLGADTFLHGRLANPPHPLGRFFEAPHILISPTYASKYPPGQAVWLALGWKLFGSPIAGAIMEGAVLVFALSLMFFAWTSRRAAIAMTIVAVYSCLVPPVMDWSLSYWGGSAAAIGAALVFLGLGRYLKSGRTALAGVLMGLGAVELFFTRPYEGGCLCLITVACLPWLSRRLNPKGGRRSLIRLAGWATPILAAGLAWAGYYNQAVTGNPLKLPYMLYAQKYDVAPNFWFLPPRPEPVYSLARLTAQHGLHGWAGRQYTNVFSGRFGHLHPLVRAAYRLGQLLLPASPLFLCVLCAPLLVWRDIRLRALLVICAGCALSLCVELWPTAHYAAPAFVAGLLCAACVPDAMQGRRLLGWDAASVLPVLVCVFAAGLALFQVHARPFQPDFSSLERRATEIRRLSGEPGRHLVVVRYPDPNACIEQEWVYNSADIDGQRVVFAHDRGPAENAELFQYFKDRRRWLATVNCDRTELAPLDR